MKNILIILILFTCGFSLAEEKIPEFEIQTNGQSSCAGEICFPQSYEVAGKKITLRNFPLYRYLGFRLYHVAYYIEEGAQNKQAMDDVTKRLEIFYMRKINREDIVEASEEIMSENPKNDMTKLRERADLLYSKYTSVQKGDRYAATWQPGKGMFLEYNGKVVQFIEGLDFANAFFGIWLGEVSVNKNLRAALLKP